MTTDDMELVREYARHLSEEAFATLVSRYVNLVYSVALRQLGDAHLAEEVSQATFIILARKAGSLGPKTILSAWLCRTAQYTSARVLRTQCRLQNREQKAYMQSLQNQPETETSLWPEIAPMLDGAMAGLGEKDHAAIVLRFFDGKSFQEMGTALGVSENAAKKRVGYALEKLRRHFSKRGVSSTTAFIAGAISAHSVQAAPAGLAVTISAMGAKGAAVAASVTSLVNGTLQFLINAKLKLAIGLSAGMLLLVGAGAVFLSRDRVDKTTDPVAEEILNKVFEKYATLSTYSDNGRTFTGLATNTFSIKLGRPDLYRMEWDAVGGLGISGAGWSAGDGHLLFFTGPGWKDTQRYSRMKGLGEAFGFYGNISGGAAMTIPPVFFGKSVSDGFGLLALSSNFLKREDAKIGDIDCYVLTGHLKARRDIPISLWIGKNDLLIHEIQRTTLDPDPITLPTNSPEFKTLLNIAGALFHARTRKPVVHTEVHENIVVNQPIPKESFVYPVPVGLQPSEH
jgi:RNA polymerase sigma factor (sigma-70 family)